jgi:hypothetical protein
MGDLWQYDIHTEFQSVTCFGDGLYCKLLLLVR